MLSTVITMLSLEGKTIKQALKYFQDNKIPEITFDAMVDQDLVFIKDGKIFLNEYRKQIQEIADVENCLLHEYASGVEWSQKEYGEKPPIEYKSEYLRTNE